jgi:hypothetical protein
MRRREEWRWVIDLTMRTGGYWVVREASAHLHKGARRRLSLDVSTDACTHGQGPAAPAGHQSGGVCPWCGRSVPDGH